MALKRYGNVKVTCSRMPDCVIVSLNDLEKLEVEIEQLQAVAGKIDLAVYDSFAYALGPDMWEECSMEFKDAMDKAAEESRGGPAGRDDFDPPVH